MHMQSLMQELWFWCTDEAVARIEVSPSLSTKWFAFSILSSKVCQRPGSQNPACSLNVNVNECDVSLNTEGIALVCCACVTSALSMQIITGPVKLLCPCDKMFDERSQFTKTSSFFFCFVFCSKILSITVMVVVVFVFFWIFMSMPD